MSDIIITGQDAKPEDEKAQVQVEISYEATEEDEERFFLMYHLNFQPSEVEKLKTDYRRWLIARYMTQKKMEQEMMQRQRLMQTIGHDLKGGPGPGLNLVH